MARIEIGPDTDPEEAAARTGSWVEANVPRIWREAAGSGGAQAIRAVRTRADYEAWYPVFAAAGLVVPTWPVAYGGLGVGREVARAIESVLSPFNLGRLNPLGLNLAAPALFTHGTEEQRLRFLPAIVRNEEKWCQLFSEPGAGSDLASLATHAEHDGDDWVVTGQKIWTTWAHLSDLAVCLARTNPDVPKRQGITYLVVDLHRPGVDIRPLRHMGGEAEFNHVFLDGVRVPDTDRIGEVGDGWRVAGATLSGERQMVSGVSSGGVDRIGGSGAHRLIDVACEHGRGTEPVVRQRVAALVAEERIRGWTNDRVRDALRAGQVPGPASSVGKVHQGELNQRIQLLATDLLGAGATGSPGTGSAVSTSYADGIAYEVRGMLRSRANTIEGGTTEINKNVIGERILGLPREPDPSATLAWREVPRS